VLVFAALGCASDVGVELADPREVANELNANAVTTGELSMESRWELNRLGISPDFEQDLPHTLEELRRGMGSGSDLDRLYALSEVSYLHAERARDRSYFLAAAIYAYAFLLRGPGETPVGAADPRSRRAGNLYERGLTRGFAGETPGSVVFAEGVTPLPFGTLELSIDPTGFSWGAFRLTSFVSGADLRVSGVRNRYRARGFGAPLVASVAPIPERASPAEARRVPEGVKVPVTALMRIESPRQAVVAGKVRARLFLIAADERQSIMAAGQRIPLEIEWTAALTDTLSSASFPPSDLFAAPDAAAEQSGEYPDGLYMFEPHRPGRIPVVLIHGTAASPKVWLDLVNELMSDSRIRQRFEFWYFRYYTTSPIAYSGALLRHALRGAVEQLDPAGNDAALRQMVLIGHSQGGLLAHLAVIHSGSAFWDDLTSQPFETLDLDARSKWVLHESLFIEPLPFVRRVIFMSTPHHGSFLASFTIEALTPWIIRLPARVAAFGPELFELNLPAGRAKRAMNRIPSSMDNMTPGNPFLERLAGMPLAPGVTAHSIMGVRADTPDPEGNDGLVEYESAHFPSAESELVIPRCPHDSEEHPLAIREIRRILREHLQQAGLG